MYHPRVVLMGHRGKRRLLLPNPKRTFIKRESFSKRQRASVDRVTGDAQSSLQLPLFCEEWLPAGSQQRFPSTSLFSVAPQHREELISAAKLRAGAQAWQSWALWFRAVVDECATHCFSKMESEQNPKPKTEQTNKKNKTSIHLKNGYLFIYVHIKWIFFILPIIVLRTHPWRSPHVCT